MARSTDSIGAPNVLASSRAPAQAGIETIDESNTNIVLIGNPLGFRKSRKSREGYAGIMAELTYLLVGGVPPPIENALICGAL
jgi:hypothetical protein